MIIKKILIYLREYLTIFSLYDYKKMMKENYHPHKKLAICIGFSPWKQLYIQEYLVEYTCIFTKHHTSAFKLIRFFDSLVNDFEVFIWSYKESKRLNEYFKRNNISVVRVEDGFIRSIGLGLYETKPLSLVFDKRGLYFNTKEISDLEHILLYNAKDFDVDMLSKARDLMKIIREKGISKYNFPKEKTSLANIPQDKKIILVIGQVEDDMSIKYGCSTMITNLDLLKCAYTENQEHYIIYKPHPDTLTGVRKVISPLSECQKFCNQIEDTTSLNRLLTIASHIYTITSLSGFEALLYGKKVTCLGSPFYSGWGLTDDRDKRDINGKIELSLEQVFYASYVMYPKYILGDIDTTINFIEKGLVNDI